MNTSQEPISDDQDDDLKKRQENNDVTPDNDDIGENTEQTQLAIAVSYDEERNTSKESSWNNNKPGATPDSYRDENENDLRIPTVTPDNDNLEAGPKRK